MDPERDAEGLLGLALRHREVAKHPEVPRVKVQGREALGEAPVSVRSQLHQQETGSATQSPGRSSLDSGGVSSHDAMVSRTQDCLCYKQS